MRFKGAVMEQVDYAVRVLEEVMAIKAMLEKASPEVLSVTYQGAATMLGLKSSKTISRMVQRGALMPVTISGTLMIPVSELRRVTTPALPARIAKRQPPPRLNGADEEARGLAMLKRR